MSNPTNHLSDEQVLLFLDGEMSTAEEAVASAHLEACPACRLRRNTLEEVLGEVISLHHGSADPVLPSAPGPRTLLKLRLEAAAGREEPWTRRFAGAIKARPQLYLYAALVVAVIGMGGFYRQRMMWSSQTESAREGVGRVPNRSLTPGATRPVRLADICAAGDDDSDRDPTVSSSTLKAVFQEYGIGAETSAKDYQVDYLINPQLGGTDDIRNLWPEPYTSTVWNARVKDALETRLHQMVCDGKLDLASAQRDIATDWIAAYQKYFHTPKPV